DRSPRPEKRRGRLRSAHELSEERDAVARTQRRVEVVLDTEDRVVHEDLDVLAELFTVPEGPVQLGEFRREPAQHASYRRPLAQRLLENAPPRAVAADELRD